jgi:hypothetical protein
MLIFDIWIDFVNLRSEKYAENSRIPTVVCTISSIPLNTHFSDLCKEYIIIYYLLAYLGVFSL